MKAWQLSEMQVEMKPHHHVDGEIGDVVVDALVEQAAVDRADADHEEGHGQGDPELAEAGPLVAQADIADAEQRPHVPSH